MNWPVSKRIGGRTGVIPTEVIGAHGGFPLSEWLKYLDSADTPLTFRGADYTHKVRWKAAIKPCTMGIFCLSFLLRDHLTSPYQTA